MLHKLRQDIGGKHIAARDGRIGTVEDVYFDDERWALRYLVVDTGDWLPGRKVLISPASVARPQPEGDEVQVALSREQVRDSPGANTELPVSRQFEEAHARYYGYPFYWDGPYLWGAAQHPVGGDQPVTTLPGGTAARERAAELKAAEQQARESHLRSADEVAGYRVVARDGAIGHVEDFVVDDSDWAVTSVIVDTRDWLPGKKVVLPNGVIDRVDWKTRELRVRATREEVKGAPEAS